MIAVTSHSMIFITSNHELLNVILGCRLAGFDSSTNLGEGLLDDVVYVIGGGQVRLKLLVGPDGLETLHEIGAADRLDTKGSNQLDGPGIHPGDIRNRILWRVLHCNLFCACRVKGLLDMTLQLLPGQEYLLGTGKGIELVAFDGMDYFDRF